MHFFRFVYRAFVKPITGRRVTAYLTGCAASWLFHRARAAFFQLHTAPLLLAELVGDKNPCSIGVLAAFRIDRAVQARLWRDVGCAGNLAGPPDWRDNGEGFFPEAKALARRLGYD